MIRRSGRRRVTRTEAQKVVADAKRAALGALAEELAAHVPSDPITYAAYTRVSRCRRRARRAPPRVGPWVGEGLRVGYATTGFPSRERDRIGPFHGRRCTWRASGWSVWTGRSASTGNGSGSIAWSVRG